MDIFLKKAKRTRTGSSSLIIFRNFSADRLGLNRIGLTKWENVWLRAVLYEFGCLSKWETLVNYSGYQEKTKHPMNLVARASGKDNLQILEAASP